MIMAAAAAADATPVPGSTAISLDSPAAIARSSSSCRSSSRHVCVRISNRVVTNATSPEFPLPDGGLEYDDEAGDLEAACSVAAL